MIDEVDLENWGIGGLPVEEHHSHHRPVQPKGGPGEALGRAFNALAAAFDFKIEGADARAWTDTMMFGRPWYRWLGCLKTRCQIPSMLATLLCRNTPSNLFRAEIAALRVTMVV